MTGVEILAMEEVVVSFGFDWHLFLIFVGLATFFMTVIVGIVSLEWEGVLVGAVAGVIFGCMFGVVIASDQIPLEYETQYKVTISDEVSMNDFLEKYEIIEQEGKIYTVREKDD